jgi:hypothetical protein
LTSDQHRPGRELNRGFYVDLVAPILGDRPHAAGLLGWGSDVLGYDTATSTDHGWGPRLVVIMEAADVREVRRILDERLPETYDGWPVRYGWDQVRVHHHVTVSTLARWLVDQIGVEHPPRSTVDWLLVPQQRLLGVVAGEVYADQTGSLGQLRDDLAWYPNQVWRWILACQWQRVSQEEPFVARTAEVGDHLGSAVVAARLVRDAMRLALLQTRRYAPYAKWLGTAFAELDHGDGLDHDLAAVLAASDISDRQEALMRAFEALARRQNALGLTDPIDPVRRQFHGRSIEVIGASRFVDALLATVDDPTLEGLPPVGSVDQVSDSTDVLEHPVLAQRLAGIYRGQADGDRQEDGS